MKRDKKQIVVWVTDEERQAVKDRAAQNFFSDGRAMSVSAYIRMLVRRDTEQNQ